VNTLKRILSQVSFSYLRQNIFFLLFP